MHCQAQKGSILYSTDLRSQSKPENNIGVSISGFDWQVYHPEIHQKFLILKYIFLSLKNKFYVQWRKNSSFISLSLILIKFRVLLGEFRKAFDEAIKTILQKKV